MAPTKASERYAVKVVSLPNVVMAHLPISSADPDFDLNHEARRPFPIHAVRLRADLANVVKTS